MSVSDIELIKATNDKLEYVHKAFRRPKRSSGQLGANKVQEIITAIQITDDTSFAVENLIYLQGKLTIRETYQLEMK